jgi:hypothetical protein
VDVPHFPSPKAPPPPSARETPEAAAPRRVVVTRPEYTAESPSNKAELTREEIRALLSTTEAVHGGRGRPRWGTPRVRWAVLIVLSLIGFALDALVGWVASTIVVTLLSAAVLVWSVLPVFRKSGWADRDGD